MASAQCFGDRGGWRWHRWLTGCGTRQSSQRRRRWTRRGVPRSTSWCRPAAAGGAGRIPGRWWTPGNAIASSRAWRGRCWPSAVRCCWFWTICNGATRRPWHSSTFCLGLSASAQILVAGTLRDDNLDDDRELAGWTVRMRATGLLTELSLSPLEVADTAHLAAAVSGRPLREADTSLLQATTGGFPLYVIEAVRGSVDLGSTPLPAGDLTAVLHDRLDAGDSGCPGGGRPRGRGGDELHPRSARRGQRPGCRHRGGGSRRAVAAQDHARVP